MNDLIRFLRAMLDLEESAALLALKGHNIGDPADMSPELRAARWHSDYERLSVIVGDKNVPMCTVSGPGGNWHAAYHIFLHQPQRVLREVEAKRKILDRAQELWDAHSRDWASGEALGEYLETMLPALALPYIDHPDFRTEWRSVDA